MQWRINNTPPVNLFRRFAPYFKKYRFTFVDGSVLCSTNHGLRTGIAVNYALYYQ